MLLLAVTLASVLAHVQFDYLMLALTWPGSICRFLSPCHIPTDQPHRFTVHGLWPQYANGSYPSDCREAGKFDPKLIVDLRERLDRLWTDFKGMAPAFWAHEWNKHGTCAISVDSLGDQHKYFNQTLTLVVRWDPIPTLAKAGIVPRTRPYPGQLFRDGVMALTRSRPLLFCDVEGVLRELRLCLTKQLQLFDCPKSQRECDPVLFLPIQPR